MHHMMSQVLPPFLFPDGDCISMKQYGINTGLRLPRPQFEKLNQMAATLNVSRNKMVALLVDAAEVQSEPAVSVGTVKANGHSVNTRQSHHAIPVVA